jgi:hypothetical protein
MIVCPGNRIAYFTIHARRDDDAEARGWRKINNTRQTALIIGFCQRQ